MALYQPLSAQVLLDATGGDTTYELINSVLAPGYDVIETPDCVHTTVQHIDEVYDATLQKYVFRFKIHKHPDNDRCKTFDRQRTEIKSYDKSPENLKAVLGEKVEYKWKFKLSADFQASSKFTHLHQIKAVGGPHDAMPLITFTARKSSPDQLELRYGEELSQITLTEIPLADFRGEWVEVTETILYEEAGKAEYAVTITRMGDDKVLLDYTNNTVKMWKTEASFLRPKWGIYRSLLDSNSLKDEDVLFSDFSITELNSASITNFSLNPGDIYPNPANNTLNLSQKLLNNCTTIKILSIDGRVVKEQEIVSSKVEISELPKGLYIVQLSSEDNPLYRIGQFQKN